MLTGVSEVPVAEAEGVKVPAALAPPATARLRISCRRFTFPRSKSRSKPAMICSIFSPLPFRAQCHVEPIRVLDPEAASLGLRFQPAAVQLGHNRLLARFRVVI